MKVLTISKSDLSGGAAIAAYRTHQALRNENINSIMLVQEKKSNDYNVKTIHNNLFSKFLYKIRPYIEAFYLKKYSNRKNEIFSISNIGFSKLIEKINKIDPDIVHLHWTCGGMIKIEDIFKIKVPIVWTQHDMWLMTGGCHYNSDCVRYLDSCGTCPVLSSNSRNDLSRKVFKRKVDLISKKQNISIVCVSNWLKNKFIESPIMKHKNISVIGNPIDTNIFKLHNKDFCRELWNLPKDKKLILFGAIDATTDKRKGFSILQKTLNNLDDEKCELVVFGSNRPLERQDFNLNVHYVGSLSDDISLVSLYNAVDVMVVPSLQEAFGQTASESISCGTPVVTFRTTGVEDIIEHKKNGFLADNFQAENLLVGINWVLFQSNYEELCINARTKAKTDFSYNSVALKYKCLYESILND